MTFCILSFSFAIFDIFARIMAPSYPSHKAARKGESSRKNAHIQFQQLNIKIRT